MSQFGSAKPGNPEVCAQCEALLMDVLDRTATPEDQAFFDRHLAGCTSCSRMFVDAKRGEAWLSMLKDPRPVPAAGLLERILAQTSGVPVATSCALRTSGTAMAASGMQAPAVLENAGAMGAVSLGAGARALGTGLPRLGREAYPGAKVIPFRVRTAVMSFGHKMLQPRLAMTAAMAFFSIALTLNLVGVHVSEFRANDLRPTNIRRNFHEANADVVRYYENLRVVYELEARVHEMQRSSDADPAPETSGAATSDDAVKKPADATGGKSGKPEDGGSQKATPKAGPGTSRRESLTPESLVVAWQMGSSDVVFPVDASGFSSGSSAVFLRGDLV